MKPHTSGQFEFRKTSPIDFCMDVLGPTVVTEELQMIMDEKTTWGELVGKKDWVPRYRAKLKELFLTANKFDPIQFHTRFDKAKLRESDSWIKEFR